LPITCKKETGRLVFEVTGEVDHHGAKGLLGYIDGEMECCLREKITGHEGDAKVWCETGLRMGFYAGLALISIVRTPFRRSDLESRNMNPVMAAVAVIAAAGWAVCSFVTAIPELPALAVSGFCICAFVASCTCLMLWGGVKTED